jgi:FkbM family methyltransferase
MAEDAAGLSVSRRPGLRRSFDVYYRDHARAIRMDRLNAAFVQSGDLVFDIGAHVGDRTGSFLRRGAKVVSLEPQPRPFRALRLLYGRCPRAHLVPMAAGATVGEVALLINRANPTVATLARDFVEAARGAPGWEGEVWDDRMTVPVTTLNALISAHGRPAFVKIDVEGHEAEVLAGLSTALPRLSFEITTIQRTVALACIEKLDTLGRYEFNLSLGEEHALRFGRWLSSEAIRRHVMALPQAANSGDIFARRVGAS